MPKPAPGSESAVVRTVIWFLAAVSLICCAIRFTAKANRTGVSIKRLSIDDWLVVCALLFSIFETVTVDIAVSNGLGTPRGSHVTQKQLANALKTSYASHFFYSITLCVAKFSAVALLRSLTPKGRHRWLALGIGALVALWTFSAIFVMAFQCNLPHPWDIAHGKCINLVSWWGYFESVNILTDFALIALPIWIIVSIHATLIRKFKLFFPFMLRVCAVAACIIKVYIWSRLTGDTLLFLSSWKIAICNAAIMTLEILPVCTIYLKQFLDSLDAGAFPAGDYMAQRERALPHHLNGAVGSGSHSSSKNPLKSIGGQEAYVRLQGETRRRSDSPSEKREDRQRALPRTAAQAYRGKAVEGERGRDIPLDHIEIRKDVTIEESTWGEGDK